MAGVSSDEAAVYISIILVIIVCCVLVICCLCLRLRQIDQKFELIMKSQTIRAQSIQSQTAGGGSEHHTPQLSGLPSNIITSLSPTSPSTALGQHTEANSVTITDQMLREYLVKANTQLNNNNGSTTSTRALLVNNSSINGETNNNINNNNNNNNNNTNATMNVSMAQLANLMNAAAGGGGIQIPHHLTGSLHSINSMNTNNSGMNVINQNSNNSSNINNINNNNINNAGANGSHNNSTGSNSHTKNINNGRSSIADEFAELVVGPSSAAKNNHNHDHSQNSVPNSVDSSHQHTSNSHNSHNNNHNNHNNRNANSATANRNIHNHNHNNNPNHNGQATPPTPSTPSHMQHMIAAGFTKVANAHSGGVSVLRTGSYPTSMSTLRQNGGNNNNNNNQRNNNIGNTNNSHHQDESREREKERGNSMPPAISSAHNPHNQNNGDQNNGQQDEAVQGVPSLGGQQSITSRQTRAEMRQQMEEQRQKMLEMQQQMEQMQSQMQSQMMQMKHLGPMNPLAQGQAAPPPSFVYFPNSPGAPLQHRASLQHIQNLPLQHFAHHPGNMASVSNINVDPHQQQLNYLYAIQAAQAAQAQAAQVQAAQQAAAQQGLNQQLAQNERDNNGNNHNNNNRENRDGSGTNHRNRTGSKHVLFEDDIDDNDNNNNKNGKNKGKLSNKDEIDDEDQRNGGRKRGKHAAFTRDRLKQRSNTRSGNNGGVFSKHESDTEDSATVSGFDHIQGLGSHKDKDSNNTINNNNNNNNNNRFRRGDMPKIVERSSLNSHTATMTGLTGVTFDAITGVASGGTAISKDASNNNNNNIGVGGGGGKREREKDRGLRLGIGYISEEDEDRDAEDTQFTNFMSDPDTELTQTINDRFERSKTSKFSKTIASKTVIDPETATIVSKTDVTNIEKHLVITGDDDTSTATAIGHGIVNKDGIRMDTNIQKIRQEPEVDPRAQLAQKLKGIKTGYKVNIDFGGSMGNIDIDIPPSSVNSVISTATFKGQ